MNKLNAVQTEDSAKFDLATASFCFKYKKDREWFIFNDDMPIYLMDSYIVEAKERLEYELKVPVVLCDQAIILKTKTPTIHSIKLFFKTKKSLSLDTKI
jgi:hypothetical protein